MANEINDENEYKIKVSIISKEIINDFNKLVENTKIKQNKKYFIKNNKIQS